MIAISLSAKVAATLSRSPAADISSLVAVRSGISAAARDLELLRAFLRFADSRRGADALASAWVDQIRDVGFELEDAADEYAFLSGGGFVRACANFGAWLALARRLGKARARLRDLSDAKERYGIRPAEASESSSAPDGGSAAVVGRKLAEAAHFLQDGEIVGFAAHRRSLMKWLTEDLDSRRSLVAVCGMGGVGKTTLVTSVYKEVASSRHFDCAAWVSVSKNFTTDDLLRKIAKELHRDARAGMPDIDEMDYRSLVEALRGHLAKKRYLLLLDDVWDADACIYPEDFLIKRKILIRLWIAEGYFEEKGQGTMEEIADDYLHQLVQRSLLQVTLKNEFGRAKRLCIHDLIRDLILQRNVSQRLLHLTLKNAYTDRILTFPEGSFPVLKKLSLHEMPNLSHVEFRKGSLVHLNLLILGRCDELTEIPQGIENLTELDNLELFEMPKDKELQNHFFTRQFLYAYTAKLVGKESIQSTFNYTWISYKLAKYDR
ncbi:hypothetical protein VPH35_039207 [Triticum aestivum]